MLKLFMVSLILGFQPSFALEQTVTPSDLYRWDNEVYQLTEKRPLSDRVSDRLRAYLYHGQRKFGEETFLKNGTYKGNIDIICQYITQLFYPTYKGQVTDDAYSKRLSNNLMPEINQRFKDEKRKIHLLTLPSIKDAWTGKSPYHGQDIPTWKPWFLSSADEYRLIAPPPHSDEIFWQSQLAEVKRQMAQATDTQKQRILFWAGMTGDQSGDWMAIVNQYMQKANTPLATQLKVREILAKTIVDATIASFDSKYAYLVKRPDMLDPHLKPVIETPNHPSFPSAHSTVSAAVVEVLNHYFPENSRGWNALLEEAGLSRIWAGIHYPIDHATGKALGKQVGQTVLQRLRNSQVISDQ